MNNYDELYRELAYLLNKGYRKKDIAEMLGIAPSTLSTYITRGIKYSLLREKYIVALGGLMGDSYFIIARTEQRINPEKYFYNVKPDILYWYPIPSPIFILLYLSIKILPDLEEDPYFKVKYFGRITNTWRVLVKPDNSIELVEIKRHEVNDIYDDLIAKTLAKISLTSSMSPPLNILAETFYKFTNRQTFYYHLYNHLLGKIVFKHYIYLPVVRDNVYCLLNVLTPDEKILHNVLNKLFKTKIFSSIEIVYSTSSEPLNYLVFGWCDINKIKDYNVSHDLISNVFYEIYPLINVETNTYIYP